MQRHQRPRPLPRLQHPRPLLHRVIVRRQHRQPALVHPPQQPFVLPVQHAAPRQRPRLLPQQPLREARVHAHHVSTLHFHPIRIQHPHQRLVPHLAPRVSIVVPQVDQHPPPLHPGLRHHLDPQRVRAAHAVPLLRHQHVLPQPVAVVEHHLRTAVVVRVEHPAHVRQRIPLRRILRVHAERVVAHHVRRVARRFVRAVAEVRPAPRLRRHHPRRLPPRVQPSAARHVQRQAQREHLPRLHLRHPLQHLALRQPVQPPLLVVISEFAPVRSRRAALPSSFHRYVSSIASHHAACAMRCAASGLTPAESRRCGRAAHTRARRATATEPRGYARRASARRA
ncbi:Uncharacterised protein [Burkholderia pseudomallei]|nr:Uncharacterised protein [Burkholderia pseudomallei]CAJ5231854.1 Uncharacterised protein [Burkholderia pseudomallei]CAJ7977466.1 Uncharacterised protein [Burkholderia pseudomallei]VBR73777.1 Uncharacterised protein [Burkholderia pseudomallei]VBU31266.1 Uncharacterised protein [Burkholderia pseudomallei]